MDKVNWPNVVNFILDECYYEQKDLAEACNVTQQTVSNWKSKLQQPSPEVEQVLTDILTEAGLKVDTFIDKPDVKITDKELLELITIFSDLSSNKQTSVIEFARFHKEQRDCSQLAYQI